MICPNCAHVYPISNGIPNMVRPRSLFLVLTRLALIPRAPAARRTRDRLIVMLQCSHRPSILYDLHSVSGSCNHTQSEAKALSLLPAYRNHAG